MDAVTFGPHGSPEQGRCGISSTFQMRMTGQGQTAPWWYGQNPNQERGVEDSRGQQRSSWALTAEREIEATPELEEAMHHAASGAQRGQCYCGQGHSL